MKQDELWNDILKKASRLRLATGATAVQDLNLNMGQERRRIQAEDEAAHQKLWGREMPKLEEEDEMILGDTTHNTTINQAPEKSNLVDWLGRAAIVAAVAAGPTYLASKWMDQPQVVDTDTDTANELVIFRPEQQPAQ